MFLTIILLFSPIKENEKPTGYLRVFVVDGMTNLPIKNANICIVDTEKYYKTDENGYSENISCPILIKESLGYKKNWGEVTILCYKEGYDDSIVFNAEIKQDVVRLGPTIYLFPTTKEKEVRIVNETPNNNWIKGLIERYRK